MANKRHHLVKTKIINFDNVLKLIYIKYFNSKKNSNYYLQIYELVTYRTNKNNKNSSVM